MNRSLLTAVVAFAATGILACGGDTPTESTEGAAAPAAPPAAQPEAAPKADGALAADPYRVQAEALVAAIDEGKSADEVLKLADELTHTGLSMLPAMVEQYPVCKGYLDAITAVGKTLRDLPIEEIESGYHQDGKLPKMPSAECYHGKDLVVHPATVSALAKAGLSTDEERRSAKGEIVEVLGHLTAIEPTDAGAK